MANQEVWPEPDEVKGISLLFLSTDGAHEAQIDRTVPRTLIAC
jgi:hypothetical protein